MFFEDDGAKEGRPIAQDTQEIGQDFRKVLPPRYARHSIHYETNDRPEKPRDLGKRSPKSLQTQSGRIRVDDIIGSKI